jgi:peptide/nickel transport system substrate-binding protein
MAAMARAARAQAPSGGSHMIAILRRAALGLASAGLLAATAAAQDLGMGISASITSMDPHFHNLTPNNNMGSHMFDRLVHMDAAMRPGPGLAESWKTIDETTWEFKLRRGVKFHDGSDFTAEDVVATIKRVPWVPNSPSSFRVNTQSIKDIQVVDPYTIRFKTEQPAPLLPIDLSNVRIISKKFVEAPTADFNSGKAAIGTGPFKLVEFVPGDRVVFERNDGYWGPKPHWKRVTARILTNNAARVAALRAGQVQIIEQVPSADLASLRADAGIALHRVVGNRIIYLHVDSFRDESPFVQDKDGKPIKPNPLKDPRVRKALSLAINRQAIVERLMEREAIPAGGLLAPGFFGVSPNLKPDPYDPDQAKKLLAAAGHPNGFKLTIHGPNDRYLNDEKILQAVGQMFSRAGIDTEVVTLPWSKFASDASRPKYSFSVLLVGWGADTGEVSNPLRALIATVAPGRGVSNRGRYSNKEVDALLDRALATVDDAKREKLLWQASEAAMKDQALIPLHYQINIWATRKGITYTPRADENTLAQFVRPQ